MLYWKNSDFSREQKGIQITITIHAMLKDEKAPQYMHVHLGQ